MKILSNISFSSDIFPAELIVSLAIMGLILIICIIVFIACKKQDPLKKPNFIVNLAEIFVTYIDDTVNTNLGPQFKKIGGAVFGFIVPYLFLSMIAGLFGVETPTTMLYIPLSLGLISFVLIHATAAYYNHIKYFKRYIEPMAFFLPINLLSMWAPLLSLTFRLFGNAIAGYVIMELVYWAFSQIQVGIVNFGPLAVVVTPFLHAYFDLFSAYIQTLVFTLLSMALIKNEVPEDISEKNTTKYLNDTASYNALIAKIEKDK
jgi:F-type H+-transporting ATPase subunit a